MLTEYVYSNNSDVNCVSYAGVSVDQSYLMVLWSICLVMTLQTTELTVDMRVRMY